MKQLRMYHTNIYILIKLFKTSNHREREFPLGYDLSLILNYEKYMYNNNYYDHF